MKTKILVTLNLLVCVFSFGFNEIGFAESRILAPSKTSTTITEILKPHDSNKNDLDVEVTDSALRANSGAKSEFSSSFNINYSGSSIEKPLDDQRPNVGNSAIADPVSLSGNFGLRYRFDKNKSLYMASGFSRSRPFSAREGARQVEVNTPQIAFNKTHALADWQLGENYLLYITTKEHKRAYGEVATFGYSVTAKKNLGHSRFGVGGALNLSAVAYDKHEERLAKRQNDYGISVIPSLQYNYSSRVNFYTQLNWLRLLHFRSEASEPTKFQKKIVSQNLGLGFAATRDIYLAPFVTFEPGDFVAEQTTVNLMATINL